MRTKITAGWAVGFQGGGHRLLRGAEVVYEDDRILYVGPRFEGPVDAVVEADGKLVSPGFIDTHVHSGHRASHRLITDTGRPLYFGQPFLEISVPKEGRTVKGDARYLEHGEAGADAALALHARFTVVELLLNGVTTFVEFGSQLAVQEALLEEVERLGARAYLAPGYDCGRWVGDEMGRLKRVRDDQLGLAGLERALAFIEQHDGASGDRVRGILVPREVETSSLELLRRTREEADARKLPMATHAAYSVLEFHDVVREHLMTPIELLERVEMLRPTLNIGHGNFLGEGPSLNYSGAHDLERMGRHGASISHCPINIIRRARTLDNWKRYQDAGVNLTLGSDTYPRDMVMNMRTASYLGKLMGHDYYHATAAEVFTAATLGGARSLGREDLGRLEAGAKADLIVIDLAGRDGLRYGPVRDPIKSLVECGVGDDVVMVVVDGRMVVEDRRIDGIDVAVLRNEAQAAAEGVWASLAEWDPVGRSAEEASPWSFPLG